ncbi:nucleoside hydrolase [Microlunatus sp. Y2014]|uniref:nucleoside hydrolase n=1 Tax=Microlunatus sp. Y2014 TaxID=3418488 RepID=UPI003DA6F81D
MSAPLDVVLDTDAYNEIDDQFAIAHLLLSPDQVNLQAIHAAGFHNARSTSFGDGMERSYEEIHRLLERVPGSTAPPVHRGARSHLADGAGESNPAADDLIDRARAARGDRPLTVVAIGAPTNVAVALRRAPDIAETIRLVWLGGHGLHWPDTAEFNLKQDVPASRAVLDGVHHLTLVPCLGVAQILLTTAAELAASLVETPLNEFLVNRFAASIPRDAGGQPRLGYARPLWDVAATALVLCPDALRTTVRKLPRLTDDLTWDHAQLARGAAVVEAVDRNAVMADLFQTLNSG